ncbi:hypothetical protein T484DRAFT_1785206 [Baffinella frigidus]|nr:hypothetical protein T484DRAFT_1785206 [Cryptophyta sp. CCMP2293]
MSRATVLCALLMAVGTASAFVTHAQSSLFSVGIRSAGAARSQRGTSSVCMSLGRKDFVVAAAAAAASVLLPSLENAHAEVAGSRPTVLVTGASSGIGRALAENLASSGTLEVVLGCRTPAKAQAAAEAILAVYPGAAVRCLSTGLEHSDLASVVAFAAELRATTPSLAGLVFCAGIDGAPNTRTAQGLELHLQVNHLASVALYAELAATLPPRAPVVSFTSSAALDANPAALSDIAGAERGYNTREAYCVSKACQVAQP